MAEPRLDFGALGKAQPVAGGGFRIPARLTRTGVFVYRNHDGSLRRELRLPEEVFAPESLATLAYAPVTGLHPDGMVRRDNWRAHSIGVVSEGVKQDAEYVASDVIVHDDQSLTRIDNGEWCETSCGYECELEVKAGSWQGQRYDAIQRKIRYNHVALGPRGWARAGSGSALRLDGGAIQTQEEPTPTKETAMPVFKVDGQDLEMSGEAYAYLTTMGVEAKQRIDTLTTERDTAVKERDTLQGRLDALEKQEKPDLDKLVQARLDLVLAANKVLEKFDAKGKSDRDVMVAVIQHTDSTFNAEGKSDEYISGVFETATKAIKKPLFNGNRQDGDNSQQRNDGPNGDGTYYQSVLSKQQEGLASFFKD